MENTSYAIEIDGEAICLDNEGENTDEIERTEEQNIQEQNNQEENKQERNQEETERKQDSPKEAEKAEKLPIVLSSKELSEELLGQVVYSEEDAYKLYCEYGLRMGFSIRKGKQYYFTGTKNIRTKDYYCSKEGSRDDDLDGDNSRPDARTNCKAMIRFRVDDQGRWKVIRLVAEHNHQLARPGQRHMLRSARSLILTKPGILDKLVTSGIQPMSLRPCSSEEGNASASASAASDNMAIVSQDGPDQGANEENVILIEPADVQCIMNHFKRKVVEEGMFYWDVQVDKEGRMVNFFWRDGRSRVDYDCFNDVVVFDTTYRTNKYNMVCAPFIGINHHWQNVMFGCAFTLDESPSSYVWLFNSFLDSMGGQAPRSIFTDQNPAVMKAVEEVFPNTRHCFAHWHVQKSVQSHLGTLNVSRTFHNLLTKCMQGCESEMEFEETWALLLREYNIQEHSWLTDLYKLREKWCTALHKDAFDGGITSQDRGESSSNVLNGIADESTSLTDFMSALDKLVSGWRRNEAEEDTRCGQSAPPQAIRQGNILKHAAEVYTHKAYKLFEAEFLDCGATSYQETHCGGSLYRFQFMTQGRPSKVWMVLIDTSTMEVTCSCKKFETMGFLCPHALNAFSLKSMDRIPDRYLLKRWTKDAKKRLYGLRQDEYMQQESTRAELAYRNHVMKYVYNLVMKSRGHEESRKLLWDALEDGEERLENFFDIKGLLPYSSARSKESEKNEKKKKKLLKEEKKSKKAKRALPSSSGDQALVPASSDNQFYPAQDARNNQSSISRPMYVQGYSTNDASSGQMYMHQNVNSITHCASQDYPAYGSMRPMSSNFGGTRNM